MNRHEIRSPDKAKPPVAAIIVAAGLSRRMGAFKLTLPWRGATVIEQVADTLTAAGLREIVAVTGHRRGDVEAALAGKNVTCVFNPNYTTGEMLSSIQTGMAAIGAGSVAVLICLGDQPQMGVETVRAILSEGERTNWQRVVIPSYQMRAGHPILIPTSLKLQIMNTTESLREVLRTHTDIVDYLALNTPTLLADLDTPDDYARTDAGNTEGS